LAAGPTQILKPLQVPSALVETIFLSMSAAQSLFEFQSAVGPTDALFLERLESFMEKSLSDIKAFAERESQPYEEVFMAFMDESSSL
jgi:hypothetical protein